MEEMQFSNDDFLIRDDGVDDGLDFGFFGVLIVEEFFHEFGSAQAEGHGGHGFNIGGFDGGARVGGSVGAGSLEHSDLGAQ